MIDYDKLIIDFRAKLPPEKNEEVSDKEILQLIKMVKVLSDKLYDNPDSLKPKSGPQ